jgi:PelA/Pel-15E family pectate lyase
MVEGTGRASLVKTSVLARLVIRDEYPVMTIRRCPSVGALAVLAVLAALACTESVSPSDTAASSDAWARYRTASAQHAAADRAVVDSELKAIGQAAPTRAAYTAADFKIDATMTDAWFAGAAASAMADAILSYQTPTGGWSKHIDYTAGTRKPGQSFFGETDSWDYIATIDNGATTTEITFLARANQVRSSSRDRDAAERGLEYLLLAQQPTGCWPQVYPLMGDYHDAATYNDDAIAHVLSLLRDVGKGGIYAFVSSDLAARVAVALAHGIDCVVASQIVVAGTKTAWPQQGDPVTLAPVVGRSYELPGISGQESAGVVNFLMTLTNPDARVVAAVHAAADWFKLTAITGYAYDDAGGFRPQAGAGSLWARIAEIGTNRPIFANRDGITLYDFAQLTDRRTGYAWFGTAPSASLKTYATWAVSHPR